MEASFCRVDTGLLNHPRGGMEPPWGGGEVLHGNIKKSSLKIFLSKPFGTKGINLC